MELIASEHGKLLGRSTYYLESLGLTCSITICQLCDAGQSNTVSNNSLICKQKGFCFYLVILVILLLVSTEKKE